MYNAQHSYTYTLTHAHTHRFKPHNKTMLYTCLLVDSLFFHCSCSVSLTPLDATISEHHCGWTLVLSSAQGGLGGSVPLVEGVVPSKASSMAAGPIHFFSTSISSFMSR